MLVQYGVFLAPYEQLLMRAKNLELIIHHISSTNVARLNYWATAAQRSRLFNAAVFQ